MLEFKRIKKGCYKVANIIIEKDESSGFWYAYDNKTLQSVVDCERTLAEIKSTLTGYLTRK